MDEVPKPQHLSKTASVEKNDPLYAESFFTDESQALAPEPDQREIHSGLEGLDKLSSTIHNFCVSKSTGYAKRVPESAFAYYSAVFAYARMLDIQQNNFRGLTFDETEYLAKVKEFNSPIPKALSMSLAGLGNTTCPNGRDLKFRLAEREYHDGVYQRVEIPGYFGEAGPHTQSVYKSYPCVAVYAQRILAEVNAEVNWNLPEGIRPANPQATTPNSNLLGYKQATPLSNEQRAFLSKASYPFQLQQWKHCFEHPIDAICPERTLRSQRNHHVSFPQRMRWQFRTTGFL